MRMGAGESGISALSPSSNGLNSDLADATDASLAYARASPLPPAADDVTDALRDWSPPMESTDAAMSTDAEAFSFSDSQYKCSPSPCNSPYRQLPLCTSPDGHTCVYTDAHTASTTSVCSCTACACACSPLSLASLDRLSCSSCRFVSVRFDSISCTVSDGSGPCPSFATGFCESAAALFSAVAEARDWRAASLYGDKSSANSGRSVAENTEMRRGLRPSSARASGSAPDRQRALHTSVSPLSADSLRLVRPRASLASTGNPMATSDIISPVFVLIRSRRGFSAAAYSLEDDDPPALTDISDAAGAVPRRGRTCETERFPPRSVPRDALNVSSTDIRRLSSTLSPSREDFVDAIGLAYPWASSTFTKSNDLFTVGVGVSRRRSYAHTACNKVRPSPPLPELSGRTRSLSLHFSRYDAVSSADEFISSAQSVSNDAIAIADFPSLSSASKLAPARLHSTKQSKLPLSRNKCAGVRPAELATWTRDRHTESKAAANSRVVAT
eukprot:Opistho-2@82826